MSESDRYTSGVRDRTEIVWRMLCDLVPLLLQMAIASTNDKPRREVGEIGHAIISCMSEHSRNERIEVRVIRDGLPEPPDNDWSKASPEERIEAVWTLTQLCWAWNQPSTNVPRLQRTVTRVQRAQR